MSELECVVRCKVDQIEEARSSEVEQIFRVRAKSSMARDGSLRSSSIASQACELRFSCLTQSAAAIAVMPHSLSKITSTMLESGGSDLGTSLCAVLSRQHHHAISAAALISR